MSWSYLHSIFLLTCQNVTDVTEHTVFLNIKLGCCQQGRSTRRKEDKKTSNKKEMRGQRIDVEQLLRQSQTELLWIQRQLSIIAAGDANRARAQKKLKQEAQPLHLASHAAHHVNRCHLLEEKNRALKLELATLRQHKQQHRSLESEVNERRKRCQILEREVKNKALECKTLKNELQDALLERKRLNRELLSHILKATQYEKPACHGLAVSFRIIHRLLPSSNSKKGHLSQPQTSV
ncbi:uncharacterized protein LOC122326660 [Puntigrus tetrazona]|uniref:uncharacterized protein LOC122326660 n=1 Tax=Puntigrus tetrazona TaxID=1606681 RepID=UPI001C8A18D4|nr:uncharacterized protein LOC122326660 [Puntigrus tetrazona]